VHVRPMENIHEAISQPGLFSIYFPVLCNSARVKQRETWRDGRSRRAAICAINRTGDDVIGQHHSTIVYRQNVADRCRHCRVHIACTGVHVSGRVNAWSRAWLHAAEACPSLDHVECNAVWTFSPSSPHLSLSSHSV